jgi:hypothetical protein
MRGASLSRSQSGRRTSAAENEQEEEMTKSSDRAKRIAALNDNFRFTFTGGRVLMTAGVNALPSDVQMIVLRKVATFSEFSQDNDPYNEHDFGSFEFAGITIMT